MKNKKLITGFVCIIMALLLVVLVVYFKSSDNLSNKFFNLDLSEGNDKIFQELKEYAEKHDIEPFDNQSGIMVREDYYTLHYSTENRALSLNAKTGTVKREDAEAVKEGDSYSECTRKLDQPGSLTRYGKSENEFDATWFSENNLFNLKIKFENEKVKSINIVELN